MKNHRSRVIPAFVAALGCAFVTLQAATAGAQSAAQQDTVLGFNRHREHTESPQTVAVELRFGRYVPNADEGLNGTPYADTFGNSNRYYAGLELDWQALRIPYLGTLGPGIGVGYTISTANSIILAGPQAGKRSDQDTTLQILPTYLVGVLRADVIAKRTAIPLVPYGKLGLGLGFWRSRDGGETQTVDGKRASGQSLGYHAAIGGMLLLDWFSVADARTADSNIGLNHSYIFGEWFISQLDGFGSKDHLNVGTSSWTVGLAFEF